MGPSNPHKLKESSLLRRKLLDLPEGPGCYLYRDCDKNLLYIGKAKCIKKRVKSYFYSNQLDAKTKRLVSRIWDIEFFVCATELEALVLENNLIKKYRPPFNILLKDDKSYPYIKLTREPYPKVYVTRKILKDKAYYFGPFFPTSAAYRTADLVYRFFQIRDCDIQIDGKRGRACLKYQLHRCTAPCIGKVDEIAYKEQTKGAKLFLEGKSDELKKRLETAMWKASEIQAFEQAAHHRDALNQLDSWFAKQKASSPDLVDTDILGSALLDDRACIHRILVRGGNIIARHEYLLENTEVMTPNIWAEVIQGIYSEETCPSRLILEMRPEHEDILLRWLGENRTSRPKILVPRQGNKVALLSMAQENAKLALEKKFEPAQITLATLEGLQKMLSLVRIPHRIECFDISHSQGQEVVASLVSFLDGKPDKSNYRRFKMSIDKNDDFAQMKEAVTRRYRRLKEEGGNFPDLVLLDGGLGQLNSALQSLEHLNLSHLECASIAKKEELIYRPDIPVPLRIPKTSPVLHLLQQIRDEAHRFAITYHRTLRSKRTFKNELASIKGIGEKSIQRLLDHFGSVKQVRKASVEEIESIVGPRLTQLIRGWQKS